MSKWRNRGALAVCLAVLLAAGVSCSKNADSSDREGGRGRGGRGGDAARPVPVSVAKAQVRRMPLEVSTFGTVQPKATVAVKAEVGGLLTKVHFLKGQDVRKDDVLFTIDSRQYEAVLKQAQAAVARDRVQEVNARKEVAREDELLKKGISAASDYDKKAADADALTAAVRAGEAAVETAALQVERCTIRSPLDGRAGDLLVDQGNLVRAGDQALVTLNQVRPVEVSFAVPQRLLPDVRKYMADRTLQVRARPPGGQGEGPAEGGAASETQPGSDSSSPEDAEPAEIGELTFVDNSVDKATGMIQLRATFANPEERLWPGQYVNVALVLSAQEVVVVPERAVQTGQNGKYVFVVTPGRTVEMRSVTVRPASTEWAIVDQGVSAGETVVTDGHLRLIGGTKVEIKADAKTRPATQTAPTTRNADPTTKRTPATTVSTDAGVTEVTRPGHFSDPGIDPSSATTESSERGGRS